MSAQTTERERYDAVDLRAYDDHDRDSPIWIARSMAWAIAQATQMPLPDPKTALRVKVRAERDLLDSHLRKCRHHIPRAVQNEIERAIGQLNDALYLLYQPRPRRPPTRRTPWPARQCR